MDHYRIHNILLFLLTTLLLTATSFAQTPAPAPHELFQLPLSDHTTAKAFILPKQNDLAYLVYATSSGNLVCYELSPTTPIPFPDPLPPPPPTPSKLFIAIIEDPSQTTPSQRSILADKKWRQLATEKHAFMGILPTDLYDQEPGTIPSDLVPFLDAGKEHNPPWLLFLSENNQVIFSAPLPESTQALIDTINKYGG